MVAWTVKNLPATQETQVQSMGQEDPLEKGMVTHSSTLAWRIPWMALASLALVDLSACLGLSHWILRH